MNSRDWHEGMVRNMEWEARQNARLDAIYEQERAKYSTPAPTTTSYVQTTVVETPKPVTPKKLNFHGGDNSFIPQLNDNQALERRLDRIENRIDKLYEMFGTQQVSTFDSSDKLFVFAPQANVNATQAITLTDQQFDLLLKALMND